MNDIVIKAEKLGKKYIIGHEAENGRYVTLRDVLMRDARGVWRKTKDLLQGRPVIQGESLEELWALRDATFEVRRGEVLGIVGRNGAGKSTLLKLLSRITEPTEGRVRIKGRVSSLLEVGTGFHPELTGRENIFLNGAILGMSQSEIKKKFDEIVAFAEIGKFLDTPVKRYSSGMHVRLAFAVAAHLEPEILVIDEVLTVGDAEFQKKCLGKMQAVSMQEGRTVLFVSHNMMAIISLCDRAIQLANGRVQRQGTTRQVVNAYLAVSGEIRPDAIWAPSEAPGNEEFKLLAVRTSSDSDLIGNAFPTNADVRIEIEFHATASQPTLCVGFDLQTPDGTVVLRSYQTDLPRKDWLPVRPGLNRWACRIPAGLLNGGTFYVCPRIGHHNIDWVVHLDRIVQFELVLNHGVSPLWIGIDHVSRSGLIAPILPWSQSHDELTCQHDGYGLVSRD